MSWERSSSRKTEAILTGLVILGIVLVVLRLAGIIDWSWWWITAPFWGFTALIAAICLISAAVITMRDAFKGVSKI